MKMRSEPKKRFLSSSLTRKNNIIYYLVLLISVLLISITSGCANECNEEKYRNTLSGKEWNQVVDCIRQGRDPNIELEGGMTPLMAAASQGDLVAIRELLNLGADPFKKDTREEGAIHKALRAGNDEIVDLLEGRHYENWRNKPSRFSEEDFLKAIEFNNAKIVEDFLERDFDVNGKDEDGFPYLIYAVFSGSYDVLETFLENDAEVNLTFDTRSALSVASMFGETEMVRLLLEHGADPNLQDRMGTTALMFAAEEGEEKIVNMLLKSGADTEFKDMQNEMALDKALKKDNNAVARILQKHADEKKAE